MTTVDFGEVGVTAWVRITSEWFAWYPVRLDGGGWAWLVPVDRHRNLRAAYGRVTSDSTQYTTQCGI